LLRTYSYRKKIFVIVLELVVIIGGTIITSLFPAYQIPIGAVALPFNNDTIAASLNANKTTILTLNNTCSSGTIVSNSSIASTSKTIEQQEILPTVCIQAIGEKMVVTKQQVIDVLNPDEPNYPEAAKLGPDALPHLDTLVKTADPLLASKATYLASLIQGEQSIDVLKAAAQSNHPEVRVAAAAGARNLASAAAGARNLRRDRLSDLLSSLDNDEDAGVRKEATKSLKSIRGTG
jgi:hypothetical protein